jgi:hypothetical protein
LTIRVAHSQLSVEQRHWLEKAVARMTGSPVDPSLHAKETVEEDLMRIILARPWRRSAACEQTQMDIGKKVGRAIEMRTPIEFSVPFGGYKGWRLYSSPHLDWAEVFWIDYLRSFAARIAALHNPGVIIYLTYIGGVLDWMNNLPKDSQETYISGLRLLLARRSSERLSFRLVDHSESIGGPDAVLRLLNQREVNVPPGAAELASARRNLLPAKGVEQEFSLDDASVERAARRCLAMMSLEQRREFNKLGPRIQITHIKGSSMSLHIGSCRSAILQPWVSSGFLEWRPQDGNWLEMVTTYRHPIPDMQHIKIAHPLDDISPHLKSLPFLVYQPSETAL